MSISKLLLVYPFSFFFFQSHECDVVSVNAYNFHCVIKLETWTPFLFFFSHNSNKHFYFYQSSRQRNIAMAKTMEEAKKKRSVYKTSNSLCTRSVSSSLVVWDKKKNEMIEKALTWHEHGKNEASKWREKNAFQARSPNAWMKSAMSRLRWKRRIRAWNIFPLFNRQTQPHSSQAHKSLLSFELASIGDDRRCPCSNRTKLKCIDYIFFCKGKKKHILLNIHYTMISVGLCQPN